MGQAEMVLIIINYNKFIIYIALHLLQKQQFCALYNEYKIEVKKVHIHKIDGIKM